MKMFASSAYLRSALMHRFGIPRLRVPVERFAIKTGEVISVAVKQPPFLRRADDRVGGFSSGMKQRLRLAFAVLHRPAVLMLDEPGSHLDDTGREVVERLVRNHAVHGLVLIATNDPQEMTLADRRIELRGRRLGDPT